MTKYDKSFPKLWLGGIGAVFLFGLFAEGFATSGLFVCAAMLMLGVYYFNKTVWCVVDEVLDYGDFLRIIKSGKQQDIHVSDIVEINLTYPNHKHLLTITTTNAGDLGSAITFRATKGYPWLRSPKLLKQLRERVKNA